MSEEKPGMERYRRVQDALASIRNRYNDSQSLVEEVYKSIRRNAAELEKIIPGARELFISELRKIDGRADRMMNKAERASVPEMGWDMYIDEYWFNMCVDMLGAQIRGIEDYEENYRQFCEAWNIEP